eukprot:6588955-Alexandrium_andersonii.AAC.1
MSRSVSCSQPNASSARVARRSMAAWCAMEAAVSSAAAGKWSAAAAAVRSREVPARRCWRRRAAADRR